MLRCGYGWSNWNSGFKYKIDIKICEKRVNAQSLSEKLSWEIKMTVDHWYGFGCEMDILKRIEILNWKGMTLVWEEQKRTIQKIF